MERDIIITTLTGKSYNASSNVIYNKTNIRSFNNLDLTIEEQFIIKMIHLDFTQSFINQILSDSTRFINLFQAGIKLGINPEFYLILLSRLDQIVNPLSGVNRWPIIKSLIKMVTSNKVIPDTCSYQDYLNVPAGTGINKIETKIDNIRDITITLDGVEYLASSQLLSNKSWLFEEVFDKKLPLDSIDLSGCLDLIKLLHGDILWESSNPDDIFKTINSGLKLDLNPVVYLILISYLESVNQEQWNFIRSVFRRITSTIVPDLS